MRNLVYFLVLGFGSGFVLFMLGIFGFFVVVLFIYFSVNLFVVLFIIFILVVSVVGIYFCGKIVDDM